MDKQQQKALDELKKVIQKYNIDIYTTIFETYVIRVDGQNVAEVNSLRDFFKKG